MERLDKILSRQLNIARSEAKTLIKKGSVTVNGALAASGDKKCSETDAISVNGKALKAEKYVYIMMNKPKGVVSATEDKSEKTVIDLLPDNMKRRGLFPAGRLDKDTTGFMLITDDGEFAHNILSPRHHVDKTYIAKLDKPFSDEVKADFESGMNLGEEKLLPAELKAICNDNTKAEIILREGIYHQIKRMFKKHGITVLELKRIALGELHLDKNLKDGECRYLTNEDLTKITKTK